MFSFFGKKIETTDAQKKIEPIVFVNSPINNNSNDVIGFESQVETLQKAISGGATMIGVVADYGTGKSSMTELLCNSLSKKGFQRPIKINMWDSLSPPKAEDNQSVSNLTKSFLFQLANGHKAGLSAYINKVLSRNYGSISFAVSNPNRLWKYVGAALLFVLAYLITGVNDTGITQTLTEPWDMVIPYLPFVKAISPVFLIIAGVLIAIGAKDINIAFSHWKMTNSRTLEINDVFDTYRVIAQRILRGKKKQMVLIDDLDRVDDTATIIAFLKELYRFQDAIINEKNKMIFIISLKPESNLRYVKESDKVGDMEEAVSDIYSKIFDATIFLKPIHFDDYDSILLKLICSDVGKKEALEKLIGKQIYDVLPASFKWIKLGSNLTLRNMKDRLNHAISIITIFNGSLQLR